MSTFLRFVLACDLRPHLYLVLVWRDKSREAPTVPCLAQVPLQITAVQLWITTQSSSKSLVNPEAVHLLLLRHPRHLLYHRRPLKDSTIIAAAMISALIAGPSSSSSSNKMFLSWLMLHLLHKKEATSSSNSNNTAVEEVELVATATIHTHHLAHSFKLVTDLSSSSSTECAISKP